MNASFQKLNIFTIVIIIFSFNALIVNAQPVTEEWVARYSHPGTNGSDQARDLTTDNNGNIYVTGGSTRPGASFDIVTIKYNSEGVEQWLADYNHPDSLSDFGNAITVDKSGNVYVTGQSMVYTGLAHSDFLTIKYDQNGVEQWIARYDGPAEQSDFADDIAVDIMGNVYIAGRSTGDSTFVDLAVIKYNSNGVQQWVARYEGPGEEETKALVVDDTGNVFVTAMSVSGSAGYDYITIKYNTNGEQQWLARYNSPGNSNDEPNDITIDNQGNIYVVGTSTIAATGADYLTIKYNPGGLEEWAARYTGLNTTQSERGNAIAVDANGNVYVTGGSFGSTAGGFSDFATVKYNSNGEQQWASRYSYPVAGIDEATCITIDNEGNVYVGGFSQSETNNDYATVKYNADGLEQWVIRYNGSANNSDQINAIALDNVGNVIVTGTSRATGSNEDYTTIKYSQKITGIDPGVNSVPETFFLYQNYPNPFNPATKIKYSIPAVETRHASSLQRVSLIVYDILGNKVATLVNESKPAGTYEVEFNAEGLSSGMYFYQLTTEGFLSCKKMVIIK
ncbi:MAG: SBBP repeat-containing protein [Ignavibacteriales bacterium]|nr:MAG: SBBP repeat-containing protein [Ignavibacteriales bacterium]